MELILFILITSVIIAALSSPIFWVFAGVLLIIFVIMLVKILINPIEYTTTKATKKLDIDEKISTENFKKTKEILNAVNFNNITESELHNIVNKLAQIDGSEFSEEVKNVEFNLLKSSLIEMRDNINSMDLESKTEISTREFYQDKLTNEQMEQAEDKINGVNQTRDNEIYNEDLVDTTSVELLTSMFLNDKNERIKKKRKQVRKLEQEHKFQRGYIPYLDAEEKLYDKYKDDEEKYLDAKIIELQTKNLSHDMYVTEEEKRIFDDEMDNGMW